MENMGEYTTIPVTPEMRNKIQSLKRGGESYESVLEKMLEEYDP